MEIVVSKNHTTIIMANFAGSSNGTYTLQGKAGLRTL
jgi:hypothetical protein